MQRKYAVPAAVMIGYAALMVLAGVIAFFAAPPEANAWTALVIPGFAGFIMIVCGLLTLMAVTHSRLGKIAAHVGITLTVAFALLFGSTWWTRSAALDRYYAAIPEYRERVAAGEIPETPEAREAFLQERGAPRHDIGYLVNTLMFLTALSVATFIVLLVLRPKPREPAAG